MWLKLNYDLLKSWKAILSTSFMIVLLYQAIIYLHPNNSEWISDGSFSFSNLFEFLVIDQFLLECITVTIVFQVIRIFGLKMKLNELRLTLKDVGMYELKFLPVLLISFFVFAPFTLTARFLFHYLPNLNSEIYFNEYFFSTSLYFNYLTPVFLIGYIIINVNLIHQYNINNKQINCHDIILCFQCFSL